MFELMVLNALTFNRHHTTFWTEAHRFYTSALRSVFSKLGRAAPPSKFEKNIQKMIEKAEKERQNEKGRVQVDESVEKKDLVAGSISTSIKLPNLRQKPPDQPSCVPFAEVKIKPVDAFYAAWLDCCYTCGTCGAADTMLTCVDCGEAFHSFCVNAPIHSMELSSVAGWRCPNCKVCEISGETPQDETRMLFCEMCDRGFSIELLEPPLNSAPKGLWVCGQCVDCKHCANSFDPKGASLKYWSRDPDKCFRCGGCNGLIDDVYASTRCDVCKILLRPDDEDIVSCSSCDKKVHMQCDERGVNRMRMDGDQDNNIYHCPTCHVPDVHLDCSVDIEADREFLRDVVQNTVEGTVYTSDGLISREEHFNKLLDCIDLRIREQWREEYASVIKDAIRLAEIATTSFGDSRIVSQHVFGGAIDLPHVMGQRALRFIIIARRQGWKVETLCKGDMAKISALAKLAASFIEVASRSLGMDPRLSVSIYDRVSMLLEAADVADTIYLPPDPIRASHHISEEELRLISTPPEQTSEVQEEVETTVVRDKSKDDVIIADTLCGWNENEGPMEWRDSRQCCLCHVCGDDDAGIHESKEISSYAATKGVYPKLGRLLPMTDGYWIHTSCALWSSDVWETPNDGKVYATEKARTRGSQLKCFGCGKSGATVGCDKGKCTYNYHFPCAKYCGAVFTSEPSMYCVNHKTSANKVLAKESHEIMRSLSIAPEKKTPNASDNNEATDSSFCTRIGALIVHSLGKIEDNDDQFHTEDYIVPLGYFATRIFWSTVRPRARTTYMLKIRRDSSGNIEFVITPGDDPKSEIIGRTFFEVYETLFNLVRATNAMHFSDGDLYSKLPTPGKPRRKTHGLNGAQFFGFGVNSIRKALENLPGVEATVTPLTETSPKYRFCFTQPSVELILDLKRRRAAAQSEEALVNASGCARTEGVKAITHSGGSGRITRALVRSAVETDSSRVVPLSKKEEEKAMADRSATQQKYKDMKAVPIDDRLVARRSHIHGWGLFTKIDVPKDNPIVEYMGEVIRRPIADKREKAYEISGEGSCYMFRLDFHRIVDATMIGCMARFMNHSCNPNTEAKIITVDTDGGQDKKIVVFAKRSINVGEEITYDYKFPIEDGSLRCTCGAPNCIGRLN